MPEAPPVTDTVLPSRFIILLFGKMPRSRSKLERRSALQQHCFRGAATGHDAAIAALSEGRKRNPVPSLGRLASVERLRLLLPTKGGP